ncbi:polysaccharide deacetylase family protein [Natronospora cellulosivora (SeqCode)]
MRFVFAVNKRIIFLSSLIIIVLVFALGFFIANRYNQVIPTSKQKLVPIYSVDRNDNYIAITLDGTWGAERTDEILAILREENINISFFFAGYWLERYPDAVKKIAAEGHEIENHTYTHPHCNSLSKDKLIEELESTSDLIEKLAGKRPSYFRPPFGEYNNNVIKTSNELGYQVIQWTIDSHDWMEPGVDYIVDRIMTNVKSGDIILMHNNAPDTPEALRKIIPQLKERGFKIVPLSDMVYKDNYYIESYTGKQISRK